MQECGERVASVQPVGSPLPADAAAGADKLCIDLVAMRLAYMKTRDGPYHLHTPTDQESTNVCDACSSFESPPCTACGRQWFSEWSPYTDNSYSDDMGLFVGIDLCMRCGHMQTEQEMAADLEKHGEPAYGIAAFSECANCHACGSCWQGCRLPARAHNPAS
jgi:hypothetical protein